MNKGRISKLGRNPRCQTQPLAISKSVETYNIQSRHTPSNFLDDSKSPSCLSSDREYNESRI